MLIELREREFYTKPSVKKREQRKRARAMYKNLSKNK